MGLALSECEPHGARPFLEHAKLLSLCFPTLFPLHFYVPGLGLFGL